MQESIKAECAKIADKEIAIHQEAARKIGAEAYYRTVFDVQQGVNAAVPFAQITIEKIDEVLSRRWAGENYSARVWQNTEVMAQKLGEIVRTNVSTGRPWERCIDEVQQYMTTPDQGGRYAATRLLRTETMHVYNEMSAEASSALGAERYRYIAVLDLKTSEVCRVHDGLIDPDTGKPYTYASRKPGKNFPPLHPWCRSIEAPYIDEDTLEGMTRPAKDPVTGIIIQVPATMTYHEWYKEYAEGNDQAKLNEAMIQNTAGDRAQLQRYREVLGKDAPKDLAAFQRLKYTDRAGWTDVKSAYRDTVSVNRNLADPLSIDAGQFGKKVGKHAQDFGLDASSAEHRERMTNIINDIVDNFDTVSKGSWRMQRSEVLFFTKAEDVVVTSQKKVFITILKGGISNARVKNARRIRVFPIL
jgi:SPP1 gp7 family putative phage head morphogenesis protein